MIIAHNIFVDDIDDFEFTVYTETPAGDDTTQETTLVEY